MLEENQNKNIPQRLVRLINDPTRIGILTGRIQKRTGRIFHQIQFADSTAQYKPESQFEFITNRQYSPLDMLKEGKLGRAVDLRRTLTHVKLSGRLADVIYSMKATNTDFYAYQFKPVIKILESPSNSLLIADEVGLGKTIEAGLIWTELRSRFDMRRLVVLCPAALREKWQRELSNKIGVSAQICDANEMLSIINEEGFQTRGFALISSIQGLRPPKGWEYKDFGKPSAKLARYLREMENEERLIDLLVIDEAHHMRNSETQTNELGRLFKNVSEYCVLLTATPIHNKNRDMFSLLQLIDYDTFSREDAFTNILSANAPLVKARDKILGADIDINEIKRLIEEASNHPLLKSNRQLSMINDMLIKTNQLNHRETRSKLAYRLETVNLLAHVITRTRKKDVSENRVIRNPLVEFVELEPVEKEFYELVTDVVIQYAIKCEVNERFLAAQPQRQMTSSMAAALQSWQKKLVEVEESIKTGDSEYDYNLEEKLGPLATEIVLRSRDYIDLGLLVKVDTKYRRLIHILSEFFRNHPNEKVIVFSTFRATLKYLDKRLKEDGINCILLMGGQRETKDELIHRFSRADGPNILLSSEVGGEGVDIQFSRILINYDLPWNPMRLEQRIGRIDRIGQKAEKITIWNIFYNDTIDSRIYTRLYDKLDLCRYALGDFEEILGGEIRKLEIELLSGKLTPEQQNRRIDQTAQALSNLRYEEEKLEQDAVSLVAYGDYILNQVQAAYQLNRWISGEDIKVYLFDYLKLNYPGCELHQMEPDSLIYDIELAEKARFDLNKFLDKNKYSFTTRLVSSSNPVRCRFENQTVTYQKKSEEVINQFHPLIRMVSSRIKEREEQLTPAVALRLKSSVVDKTFKKGIYVIAVQHWYFSGLQDIEKLSYAATGIEEFNSLLDPTSAENLATVAVARGEDWLEAVNIVDMNKIYNISNEILFGKLDREFSIFCEELKAKNEDRADIQLHTLEHHYQNQMSLLENIADKHRSNNRYPLLKATEGRIMALKLRVDQQRLIIKNRRKIKYDSKEIALAIILIV